MVPAPSGALVHAASLVDPASHSPALMALIDIKLSRPVIDYAIDCVVSTVDFALGRKPSTSAARGRSLARQSSAFSTFVTNVITRSELATPVLIAALTYVDRARPHLQIALEEWACERVFLGAVMVASKYLNDSTLKNVHWALCTGVFGKRDVGRIEREFLDVLDFELGITEKELLAHRDGLTAAARESQPHLAVPHQPTHHHRNHKRNQASYSSDSSMPELEPSSPHSSSTPGSASPLTPMSIAPSPIAPKGAAAQFVAPSTSSSSSSGDSSSSKRHHFHFAELIRSFPMPHHHEHHPHAGAPQQHKQPRHAVPSVSVSAAARPVFV